MPLNPIIRRNRADTLNTLLVPNFEFKPACGVVNNDGSVTVSGMRFTEQEIERNGRQFADLVDIVSEIDEV